MPSPPVSPGHPDYFYWSQLRYRGSTGVRIILDYDLHRPPTLHARWWWRFVNSGKWRGGTTDKLGALIHAARTCGCTAKAMDWEAEVPGTRIPRQARPQTRARVMAQRGPTKYELRAAVPTDGEFFYAVKRQALREAVVNTFGAWDEEWQREKFFANFVPSTCEVLMVEGRDAGMLAVDREADPIYVGGIYLLPEHQRHGLGTAIMREVLVEAAARGRDVHLQVLLGNPDAKRFYERLGFEATEQSDSHTQMRWRRVR